MFYMMEPPTEEERKREAMQNQQAQMEFWNFLQSLSNDEKETLRRIMVSAEHQPNLLSFIQGILAGMLAEQGICFCKGFPGHTESEHVQDLEQPTDAVAPVVEEDDEASLKEYGLILSSGNTKYKCQFCGIGYVSLDDRMMKQPGVSGCSGCQQATKSGNWLNQPTPRWMGFEE